MWYSRIRRYGKDHPVEAGLLAAGCVLRLFFVGLRSMWVDEALTLVTARAAWGAIPGMVRSLQGTPPFYFFLIHAWLPLFHDPLIAIRFFSVACGILALCLYAYFCRRAMPLGSELAVFFGATSSYWISLSQDGKLYSLYLLISIAHLYLLFQLTRECTARRLSACAITALVGMYTHTFFAFFLAAGFIYFALVQRNDLRRLLIWCGIHAMVALAYVPWIPSLIAQMRIPYKSFPDWLTFGRTLHTFGLFFFDVFFVELSSAAWIQVIGFAVVAACLWGAWSKRLNRDDPGSRLARLCAFCIAAMFVMAKIAELLLGRPITQPRYFTPLSAPAYILLAQILADAKSNGPSWRSFGRIVAGVLVGAGTIGYFACGHLIDPHLSHMSAAIRKMSPADMPVVHLYNYYYPPMRYYYLPERENYLLCPEPVWVNWSALPGYPSVLKREELMSAKLYVYVDPHRRLSAAGIGFADGATLSKYQCE